ncbi:MAG: TonB-dependent receptor [Acidobacteriota bacterium]
MYQIIKLNIKFIGAAAILCIALLTSIVNAQFDSATMLGTVRDAAGAVVPNASVTLKNTGTGITATTTTDSEGNYQFLNVKIGTYQVVAEAAGFSKVIVEDISAEVNARQRVDVTLQAGAVSATVTVNDTPELLETDTSERGQVIKRAQIINLPLNGRAYADLTLLSPGVNQSQINVPGQSGARDASFNVNGLRSSLNNFILDGVDNNSYGTSNQGFSNQVEQPSPDAIEEFKVQTNNYSAEFGRAGGAVINAAIRSGTNGFHGSVWDYVRNTEFNATGFFKPVNNQKPVLIQNQYGFAFGGPIIKNRLFFFMDYEGYRRIAKQVSFATLPTLEQRQGIFRNANGTPIPIRNPLTGTVYANGIVPQSDITGFAAKVFGDLPLPNLPGAANNYSVLPRSQFFNDKGDVKLDYTVNNKLTAFARGSSRKVYNFEAPTIEGASGGNSNSNVFVINEQIAGGATFTLTPTSVLEFRLGVSRTKAGKRPYNLGAGNLLTNYGISGLPTDPSIAGGLNSQSISGFTQLGRQSSNPQFQNPTVIDPRVNYTFIAGRHSFKVGYEYQRINTDISDSHPKYGQDTYSGQFSRPTGAASNSVYNVADFLFGARSSYQLTDTFVAKYRQRMHFGYVQDDFNVNPNLTLNLGLRYEFATPQYEAENRLSNFDPQTNTVIVASSGSLADRALVKPDKNNFAPRLGFAWKAAPRTVLRGGYGISYIHFNRLGGENILSLNPPQVFNVTIDQIASQPLCVGSNFTNCFRPTQAGYPTGLLAPTSFNALRSRVNYTPFDNPTAYVQSFHLTIQYEILKNLLVDFGYVGNRTSKLIILADINQARPNGVGENTPLQQRRPISGFSFIQGSLAQGEAQYDSFQLKVERRFTQGLYLLNSLTLSKAQDNAPGHLEASNGDNSRANYRNLGAEYGVSSYDVPVNNTTSVVYDLPFGRGRRFGGGMNRVLDAIFGGYRFTAINRITSGRPVNLTYSPTSQFSVGGDLSYRPNIIGQVVFDNPTPNAYFDRTAVAIPTDPTNPFGDAPRNAVRGPNFWQADIGLHKQFRLYGESTRLELRVEAFNVFNRTNFGTPNGNVSSSAFGTITSAYPAREIQFAAKIYF